MYTKNDKVRKSPRAHCVKTNTIHKLSVSIYRHDALMEHNSQLVWGCTFKQKRLRYVYKPKFTKMITVSL